MLNSVRLMILCGLALIVASVGCSKDSDTTVNISSHLMDAEAFDLEAVAAKLKTGDLADAAALEKFINTAEGVNNIDLDKDGQIDELTVKEEKGADGKTAMAIVAHPKTGEESVVAEVGFEKTASGDVQVSAAYPEHVRGYRDHYYNHTLTGSHLGDMMFYSWMFSPRPVYVPSYRYGMYYSSPRSVMSRQQMTSRRTTYRKTTKMAPVRGDRPPQPSQAPTRIMMMQLRNGQECGPRWFRWSTCRPFLRTTMPDTWIHRARQEQTDPQTPAVEESPGPARGRGGIKWIRPPAAKRREAHPRVR